MNPLLCSDSIPSFLHFFDLSIAPPLLFYTYAPTIIISLLIGFFVYYKDKTFVSKILLGMCVFFTLWVANIFILWIASYNDAVMFGWQITPIFEVPLFIFSLYFAYVITDKERHDIKPSLKLFFLGLLAVTFSILPTYLNITNYNLGICEGVPGRFWDFMYIGEMVIIAWIFGLCINRLRALQKDDPFRRQIVLFGTGIVSFLVLFNGSNLVGQITGIQEISFIGSLGMTVFLVFLAYMIVKFHTFNLKIFATQALVIGISILIGSQLFSPSNISDEIITILTLVAFLIAGFYLIRSVRREIEAKESLKISNKKQEDLIHIMNHQIKGFFTVARNIFAELSEGETYGKMSEKVQPVVLKGLQEMNDGVDYVQSILRGESASSGTLPFDMKPMDLKPVIENLISKQKEVAEKKGLSFESNIADGNYNIVGDAIQLDEAFKNLFTNAIKYNNPNGGVKVTMSNKDNKILFAIKDTGIGISEEDQKNLFKPGGMGKDSIKHNTDAAGYGLAFVKPVIETHKDGKIWYDTELGKGTTFFVELPIRKA